MIDKALISRRFSLHAAEYDRHANVQRTLGASLIAQIHETGFRVRDGGSVLEVGSGTGRVTRRILEQFPQARIHAVDIAPGMVDEARRALADDRVTFTCADAEEMPFVEDYRAIISSATFQWFAHPGRTVERLARALEPGGLLAFSTLTEGTFHELRVSFEEAAQRLNRAEVPYPGLSFLSTSTLAGLIPRTPRFTVAIREAVFTEEFTSVRQFLREVKGIGASGDGRRPMPPALLLETERVYRQRFGQGGVIPATYRCASVLARRE